MTQLSIILPIYNAESYLCECLNSILGQTYQDYELICVDDGSVDSSPYILKEYSKKDDRIKIISQKNCGLISARKVGLATACGKYTTFVDADDWLDENMYEVMMRLALAENAEIVTSGCILEYPAGSIIELEQMKEGSYEGGCLEEIFYPHMIGLNEFFTQNISMHIWNKLYNTELIKQNVDMVPNEIAILEDAACVYPALLGANKIVVTHRAFYHYRMRETSMMGRSHQYLMSYKDLYYYLQKRFKNYSYTFLDMQLKMLIIFEILLISPQKLWKEQKDILPYRGVENGSKVVMYGMGRFGKLLKRDLEETGRCKVVAVIDQNRRADSAGMRCYSLEEFLTVNIEYDIMLISILKRNICGGVKEKMIELGIPNSKIKEPDIMVIKECELRFEP